MLVCSCCCKLQNCRREWQREIVVVQLDVKKALDHVDHRAAFKAMKLQDVSPFSMALDCCNLEWKLHESMLWEQISSSKVQNEQRSCLKRAPESPVIFTMIMELVLRDLIKSWITQETGLETGRLCAGCDLLCGRCGVDCCFGVCCRNNGVRSDRKTERGWTDGWRTENTLDEFPEDDGHTSRWMCVLTGMHDMRSHTEQLKPTNAAQNGNLC